MNHKSIIQQAPSHPPQRLAPDFLKDFVCLGGECGNTCCRDWGIYIGKLDYKRIFDKLPSGPMRKTAHETIRRLPNGTNHEYAKICLNSDRLCGFYDGEGLCSLQKKLGAEVLPALCRQFPRRSNVICHVREGYLYMGCEGVIRLLISRGERPITFSMIEQEERDEQGAYWFKETDIPKNPVLRCYWDGKALGIAILQSRFYTLEQRLLYLGLVMESLQKLCKAGRWEAADTFIHKEMEKEDDPRLRALLEQFPTDELESLRLMTGICGLFSQKGSPPYRALAGKVKETLEMVKTNSNVSGSVERCKASKEGYGRFCEAHPYLMEQIAVALFHVMALPAGGVSFQNGGPQTIDIWDNYVFYCTQLAALRFMLAGADVSGMDDAAAACAIATVLRRFPNKGGSGALLAKELMKDGRPPMEQLSILIRG